MSGITENMMTKKATITNPGKMERTRMVRLQHQISIENALWAEHPAVRFRMNERQKRVHSGSAYGFGSSCGQHDHFRGSDNMRVNNYDERETYSDSDHL